MRNRIEPIKVVLLCTVRGNPYLGFHVGTAGLGAEGGEVAQGLGLLLETHDAVLLEHDEGGMSWSRCHYPLVDVFSLILTLSREQFMT